MYVHNTHAAAAAIDTVDFVSRSQWKLYVFIVSQYIASRIVRDKVVDGCEESTVWHQINIF